VVAVAFIVFTKLYLLEKFKKQLNGIPVPVELFILIIGIATSHFLDLNASHHLAVVGFIPSGLSKPSLPHFSLLTSVVTDRDG